MTDPTAIVDYSRPVGWWCLVCGVEWSHYPHTLTHVHQHAAIPRYLPIPEGQRPPAASEVEEAEVVTYEWVTKQRKVRLWAADSDTIDTKTLNRINRANAIRIVTGATE